MPFITEIQDLTVTYAPGKWTEVVAFSTLNPNEKPDVLAKFRNVKDARMYAQYVKEHYSGYTTIVIR